ncbi:MAG: hypothetical protein FJ091_18055 [Deltaproteobacteria bacterium]|nr:hypothetical protein [Deltaproteobacteria bacterium]
MSACQQQYWTEMTEFGWESNYLLELIQRDETLHRRIDVILAVASSASISGWAIWSELGFVWAGVIAASQVIATVRHVFSLRERLHKCPRYRVELEQLLLAAERDWFDVAEGIVDERRIHEMRISLRERKAEAEYRCLGELTIPSDSTLSTRADQLTRDYFIARYPGRNS